MTIIQEHPNLRQDRVELFLTALESGDYTQCKGSLRAASLFEPHKPWRHCALGVATDVALENGLMEALSGGEVPEAVIESRLFDSGSLDETVLNWYGFDSSDPWLARADEGELRTVSSLNDNGWTFWDIAQAGRARWLKDQG